MSAQQLDRLQPVAGPRIGQATAIEQSRAVAEVQAQVIVAQRMPRDIDSAVLEMQRSCSRVALAEKAFYRFPRGGQQVTGETIVLAKELARCWGNLDYGLAELRRDDYAGESEMMAFAWDLQTNTRPRTTFIVPHVRDRSEKKGGAERLTETRDIYELNANMGARRMREMIFNVLPPWFIEDAKALCYATLASDNRDGTTQAERAATAVKRFAGIGVRAEQLTQKLGAPQAHWSAADLGHLAVIFKSIDRGETTIEAEFGAPAAAPVTVADLAPPKSPSPAVPDVAPSSGPAAVPPSAEVAAAGEAPSRPPQKASTGQVGMIRKAFERLAGVKAEDETPEQKKERLRLTSRLARVPHPGIASTRELTAAQARDVRDVLARCETVADVEALLDSGALAGDPRDQDGEPGE